MPEDTPTSPETPSARRSSMPAPPSPRVIELVDVSAFQPEALDYRAIAGAGIAGAMVKLSDGAGSPDRAARAHVAGFRTFGMRAGGYHYLRVRAGAQDATAQAREFCGLYRALGCDLVPALDCEGEGNEGRTATEWLAAIRDFCTVLEGTLGANPMVYSYPYFWRALGPELADAADLAQCPLWWAEYGPMPHPPYPWGPEWPALWQYTDKGRVAGIPGPVDRSQSRGSLVELVAACAIG